MPVFRNARSSCHLGARCGLSRRVIQAEMCFNVENEQKGGYQVIRASLCEWEEGLKARWKSVGFGVGQT